MQSTISCTHCVTIDICMMFTSVAQQNRNPSSSHAVMNQVKNESRPTGDDGNKKVKKKSVSRR